MLTKKIQCISNIKKDAGETLGNCSSMFIDVFMWYTVLIFKLEIRVHELHKSTSDRGYVEARSSAYTC